MAFNSFHAPFRKGKPCQRAPVERPVYAYHRGAEMPHDLRIHGLARLHHCAAYFITAGHKSTQPREAGGNGALAAGHAAGQRDPKHGYGTSPRRAAAALTVFCISIAIVSAPTPPGTGV